MIETAERTERTETESGNQLPVERRSLSVKEFAQAHGVSTDLVYTKIKEGKFPFKYFRLGTRIRITMEKVEVEVG
jgi:excisionase family DNA binding protein